MKFNLCINEVSIITNQRNLRAKDEYSLHFCSALMFSLCLMTMYCAEAFYMLDDIGLYA